MVRTLELYTIDSGGRGFDSRSGRAIKWLLPGWVTVCRQVNHLGK